MIISFLAELYKPIRILWWAFEVTVEVLWEVGNSKTAGLFCLRRAIGAYYLQTKNTEKGETP
jgi:hypothetical protein